MDNTRISASRLRRYQSVNSTLEIAVLAQVAATLTRPTPAPPPGQVFPNTRPAVQARNCDALALPGVQMAFGRGEEVFGEGEPAEFVYRVVSGAVRTYRVLNDGRRQISDFHLPDDIFGLEAGLNHTMGCDAVSDTVLMLIRRRALATRASEDCGLSAQIWSLTAQSLLRTREHMLLLGRQGACERVCAFLLDLSERLGDPAVLALPMSRQDMADYLGLTIETVSRTLTQLQSWRWIALPTIRSVVISDRAAIQSYCS